MFGKIIILRKSLSCATETQAGQMYTMLIIDIKNVHIQYNQRLL